MEPWTRTWRATVESFLRELRGTDADARIDAMADAIAEVSDRLRDVENQLDDARDRLEEEEAGAADCRRRETMARRIGDEETARVAQRFGRGHEERAGVLRRKREILHEEVALLRRDLDEMLTTYRSEAARDEPQGARDSVEPGADPARSAEPSSARPARRSAPESEPDPLAGEFRRLDDERRAREAEQRLEELKRRGGHGGREGPAGS